MATDVSQHVSYIGWLLATGSPTQLIRYLGNSRRPEMVLLPLNFLVAIVTCVQRQQSLSCFFLHHAHVGGRRFCVSRRIFQLKDTEQVYNIIGGTKSVVNRAFSNRRQKAAATKATLRRIQTVKI